MSRCYCRVVLSILVIVFAWLTAYAWAKYVLTILGAILAIQALAGVCCCAKMKEEKKEASENPENA